MPKIRSLKPDWVEDEKLAACDDASRVLSAALIVLADDYGRGRAHHYLLGRRVWPFNEDGPARATHALEALARIGFVRLYESGGERYFVIRNWDKHQRIDKRTKSRLPDPPPDARDSQIPPEPVEIVPGAFRTVKTDVREFPGNSGNLPEPPGISRHLPQPCGKFPADREEERDREREEERTIPSRDGEASPPAADLSAEIQSLESRYPDGLAKQAREACSLARRSGRMSDSVWLATLRKLAAHPPEAVAQAVSTFVDRHADGDKDERYLLGIVRGQLRPRAPPTSRLLPVPDQTTDMDAVVRRLEGR